MKQVDEKTFFAMTETSKLLIVDFMADWCGPCRFMEPRLDAVSRKLRGVDFVQVNIDEAKTAVRSFGLRKVPTVLVIKSGVELARREGVASEGELLSMVQDHL